MTGALHGLALRGASLAAKLAFLVWILPRLPAGEVSRYLLLTTAGALVGRLLGLGLEEELPLVVRGDHARARRLAPASRWALVAAGALGAAAVACGPGTDLGRALAVGCSALALTSTIVLVGLVRTLSPSVAERLVNGPPLLLLALAALATPRLDAARLVLLGAAAQAVVAVGTLLAVGLARGAGDARADRDGGLDLRACLAGGATKLASNLLLLLQVRALGWAPALLGRLPDDALSLAVLVGEAGVQLGSVVAQRHYAEYARGEGDARLAARRGLAAAAALGCAAAMLAALPAGLPGLPPGLDLRGAPWALAQAGALVATLEARYFRWSRSASGGPVLASQVAWLLAVGGVVLALPAAHWLAGATCAAGLLAGLALLGLAALPRRQASG